jgi:hypothetical protein
VSVTGWLAGWLALWDRWDRRWKRGREKGSAAAGRNIRGVEECSAFLRTSASERMGCVSDHLRRG